MKRTERLELEQRVQILDREHPEWSARDIEHEIQELLPTVHGTWSDETPELSSRLRAVQRWRGAGEKGLAAKQAQVLFPHLWPLGERQRHELEPAYTPATRVSSGSWRLFLYNCGPEVVRELHIRLEGEEVGYSPFLLTGRFTEVLWQRVPSVKARALVAAASGASTHPLDVRFVIAKGTRTASLTGDLKLEAQQGFVEFDGGDGRTTEIE